MRKIPKFLHLLLTAEDVDSKEFRAAAAELERQPHLRPVLEQLAVGDPHWWYEAQTILAESGLPADGDVQSNSIVVEVESTLGDDVPVDCEQVSLDFLQPPRHPELLGRLDRYEIERVLGTGGMGVVLRAFDTDLHRIVAIKVLAAHLAHHSSARRRFAREAQAAAAVVHPHVIPIFNVESDAKIPYIVMHYVAGQSLQRRIDVSGPLPIIEALRIAQQTAAGLSAAHAQGLVHRDVKPANILLEEQIDRVLLSDFGLARAVDDASLTRTGIVAGTPHYMSPEQALGEAIDHRSDLFSLGSVLYFMLTGHPPFRAAGAMAVLHRICQLPHRPVVEVNRDVPMEVSQLIDRLLAKKPSDRVATATQAEAELGELLTRLQQRGVSIQSLSAVHASPLVRAREILKGCLVNSRFRRRVLVAASTTACVVALMFSLPHVDSDWWQAGRYFGSGIGAGVNTESEVKNQATVNDNDLPAVQDTTRTANATHQATSQVQASQHVPTAFDPELQTWASAEIRFSQELSAIQRHLLQLKASDYASPNSDDSFQRECESIRRQLEALNKEL